MGYREDLAAGRIAFAHLVRVWHERNAWSHKVLPALAEALDLGRVHNSQISMLRNGKLASPGPEVFLALGRINQLLAADAGPSGLTPELRQRLADRPELVMALESSALPVQDDGAPVLGPGEFLEVFVGLRQPPLAFDLRISEAEAAELSEALTELFSGGRPWRLCRDEVLTAYPASRRQRRDRFTQVMAGLRDYTAGELEAELPELLLTARSLGVSGAAEMGADGLLDRLRQRRTEPVATAVE
ncbi:MAG: hypothetical protein VKK98_05445 [Cyanobacteriota bacterium]|nr:hypothetical protein [Cyanobacteriota bacterium]